MMKCAFCQIEFEPGYNCESEEYCSWDCARAHENEMLRTILSQWTDSEYELERLER